MSLWRILVLIATGALAATAGLWASDRTSPTQVIIARAETPVVAPGGVLKIHYEVFRLRSCAVRVDRLLFDADRVRVSLEDQEFAGAPGPLGHDSYTTTITIPRSFAQGPGRYTAISRYECNLLHKAWPIVVGGVDVEFMVSGDPAPGAQLPIEIVPRN
jgi:hypothetical protein